MFSQAALRLPALAVLATVLAWTVHGALWPLDTWFYDVGAVSAPPQARDDLAILGIDENFMAGQHPSVVPRERLAKLLTALTTARPHAVVIDVWLDSRFEPMGDVALRNALLQAKKRGIPIFLSDLPLAEISGGSRNLNGTTAHSSVIPYFRDAAATAGNVSFELDGDHVARALPASPDLMAMPWLAAFSTDGRPAGPSFLATRLQREPIPIAWNYQVPHTPAYALLQQPFLAALLEGKTVFIGATYARSQDFFKTPLGRVQAQPVYGVELLAYASATLRDGARRHLDATPSARLATVILALLLAWLAAALAWRGATAGLLSAAVGAIGILALAFYSAHHVVLLLGDRYWPPSLPLLSVLFSASLAIAARSREQARELKLVRDTFGAYVGDEVLQALGNRMPEMGGEIRQIAVLFCDIRGYSALAERMQNDPAKLMNALNEHFEPLVEALKARGAYADNYVGDLVMALCGAPVSQGYTTDVQNAVAAANDFVRLVEERNVLRKAAGEEPIEVGIGLHCGEAVVGNLGSKRKIHYTAIGDVVNIASRVESSTRKYGVPLLVTEEIVRVAGGSWEFVEETTVKGRAAPVRLYRAAGEAAPE